ncbi:MAG TPA: hypothetical protein VN712_10765, partial [Dermatophilaceae bacterium]|nr:hypothetical protein [Dermatophilaceae bacterium]
MTPIQRRNRPQGASRARWTRLLGLVAIPLAFILAGGVAWGYWSAGSAAGSHGASAATTVNQGATPTASAAARAVTLSWAATTLSNGNAVNGYIVKRYDVATLIPQSILSGCAGMVAATTCTEDSTPAGQWVYSVTPVFATNWRGAESLKSSTVTLAAPALELSSVMVRPGMSLTGTAVGFIGGETLRYHLDSTTGT